MGWTRASGHEVSGHEASDRAARQLASQREVNETQSQSAARNAAMAWEHRRLPAALPAGTQAAVPVLAHWLCAPAEAAGAWLWTRQQQCYRRLEGGAYAPPTEVAVADGAGRSRTAAVAAPWSPPAPGVPVGVSPLVRWLAFEPLPPAAVLDAAGAPCAVAYVLPVPAAPSWLELRAPQRRGRPPRAVVPATGRPAAVPPAAPPVPAWCLRCVWLVIAWSTRARAHTHIHRESLSAGTHGMPCDGEPGSAWVSMCVCVKRYDEGRSGRVVTGQHPWHDLTLRR